jgi:hypothetical protein
MIEPHNDLPLAAGTFQWPSATQDDSPHLHLDPALKQRLLGLCGEVLAATFIILQESASTAQDTRALQHLGRAQSEVTHAQAWLLEPEGGG